jgi:hypothetical protein
MTKPKRKMIAKKVLTNLNKFKDKTNFITFFIIVEVINCDWFMIKVTSVVVPMKVMLSQSITSINCKKNYKICYVYKIIVKNPVLVKQIHKCIALATCYRQHLLLVEPFRNFLVRKCDW